MPESRDRLIRENPLDSLSGRASIGGLWPISSENERELIYSRSRFNSVVSGELNVFGSPMGLRSRLPRMGSGSPVMGSRAMASSWPGLVMRTPLRGQGIDRNRYGSPYVGRENVLRSGTSQRRANVRIRNSPLPIWYPRTPLRDVTTVVNAVERRRTRHRLANLSTGELGVSDPSVSTPGVPLKHDICKTSPIPTTARKRDPLSVLSKILLDGQNTGESFLTPQKKLLNSIDLVEKIVMEELRMMKRTPSAKRAERERKVRNLMSMR